MIQVFHKKEGQKGFTLIELMIVIVIIGVLAAIAIPQFILYKKKGYVAAINSDCKNAYTAALAYNMDHSGVIPDLVAGGYAATSGVSSTITSWSNEANFVITCTGDPQWSLNKPATTYTVVNGELTVDQARK